MSRKALLKPLQLSPVRTLDTLVESRKRYSFRDCELDIYETHTSVKNVSLKFSDFAFTSMIRGKKELKITDKSEKFEYLPGESVIMLPGEEMLIDFPEADTQPSQCLALSISKDFIKNTVDYLNGNFPKADNESQWKFSDEHFYLFNSASLSSATNNILRIATEDNSAKDFITDLALKELLIRIMQTQARKFFETNYLQYKNSNRFAAVIDYIKNNIHDKISMDLLAKKSYMSKSNFFRAFKQEFGISPNRFILQERIDKAKMLLQNYTPISETAFQTGFSDTNYFIKAFKDVEGITPKCFQRNVNRKN
ncbi:AraC family transcriptional regulator [Arachidicoccus ginsenosidimutans]|uniref:helix-turn-helix domain-containing protein n=1 Tax=Arachidicoccus sp. BS20 TaxID=1850526 RepID=UPI0007F074EA|nr:helix-turn-helix domain-containing protein [Arachidicoccus sp. BS20]ANI90155.1 AraC family transcriptional regulator [Arachidicoccus sp. BS20]